MKKTLDLCKKTIDLCKKTLDLSFRNRAKKCDKVGQTRVPFVQAGRTSPCSARCTNTYTVQPIVQVQTSTVGVP